MESSCTSPSLDTKSIEDTCPRPLISNNAPATRLKNGAHRHWWSPSPVDVALIGCLVRTPFAVGLWTPDTLQSNATLVGGRALLEDGIQWTRVRSKMYDSYRSNQCGGPTWAGFELDDYCSMDWSWLVLRGKRSICAKLTTTQQNDSLMESLAYGEGFYQDMSKNMKSCTERYLTETKGILVFQK